MIQTTHKLVIGETEIEVSDKQLRELHAELCKLYSKPATLFPAKQPPYYTPGVRGLDSPSTNPFIGPAACAPAPFAPYTGPGSIHPQTKTDNPLKETESGSSDLLSEEEILRCLSNYAKATP